MANPFIERSLDEIRLRLYFIRFLQKRSCRRQKPVE